MADAAAEMEARFSTVSQTVEREMARLHVPGVALGVLYEDRERVAGFGSTSVEGPLPVDGDTFFQVGSISKTFTATALMRLVERGHLHMDAPVRSYLPSLRLADPTVTQHVTLRHLLNHTAGWLGDYFDDTGSNDDALARMVARLADLPQLTPLGAVWSYNNAAFYLAGYLLEVMTHQPFEVALRELVLDPLGLTRTTFSAADVISYRVAVGHEVRPGEDRPVVARPWGLPRALAPVGGLISNVRDLLRYARFWLGDGQTSDGTRLLRPETMRLMRSPLTPAASQPEHMGIAWMLSHIGPVEQVYHGGATNGQVALLALVPEQRFALVVLTNCETGGELNEIVNRAALREWLGAEEAEVLLKRRSHEQLAPFTGHYIGQASDLDVRQGEEESILVIEELPKRGFPTPQDLPPPPPPMRVAFFANDRVIGLDSPQRYSRGEFLRDEGGAITWLRLGSRIHRRAGP